MGSPAPVDPPETLESSDSTETRESPAPLERTQSLDVEDPEPPEGEISLRYPFREGIR